MWEFLLCVLEQHVHLIHPSTKCRISGCWQPYPLRKKRLAPPLEPKMLAKPSCSWDPLRNALNLMHVWDILNIYRYIYIYRYIIYTYHYTATFAAAAFQAGVMPPFQFTWNIKSPADRSSGPPNWYSRTKTFSALMDWIKPSGRGMQAQFWFCLKIGYPLVN